MSGNNSCKDCRAHSGVKNDITHLQDTNKEQWLEINSMKKWLIATLTSSVFTLIGIIVIIVTKV